MNRLKYSLSWAIGLYVMFSGARELEEATTWISFFRGLIWTGVASLIIWDIKPQSGSKGSKND